MKLYSPVYNGKLSSRKLFLKWALLNALTVVFLVVLGIAYGGKLHGVPVVTIPIILLFGAYGSAQAGRLCWRAEGEHVDETPVKYKILHDAQWLDHWGWICPMIGILSSIAGMSVLIGNNDPGTLATRISSGGGAIFYGTFVGVLMMLLHRHEHRMIEHELGF